MLREYIAMNHSTLRTDYVLYVHKNKNIFKI